MIVAIFWPDVLRFCAVVLGVMAMALFPGALLHRVHGWRACLVTAVVVLLFGSLIVITLHNIGHSLHWYRSPVLLVASILALIYVVSIRGRRFWYDR